MEFIKGFFTKDNITKLFERFYGWLENILDTVFGGMGYEPLRDLFINPWFFKSAANCSKGTFSNLPDM